MKVVHMMRKPCPTAFSIEQEFADVRSHLPHDIDIAVFANPFRSAGILRRLAGMVCAACNQGDINHVTGDNHFLALLLRRRRTILTIHDCASLDRRHGLRYRLLRYFWYQLPARRAAKVTVISEAARQQLQRHLGKQHDIVVIPCPVSPDLRPAAAEQTNDPPVILQVGTAWNKNLARVVDALRGIDCRLVIIGNIPSPVADELAANGTVFENHINISRRALIDHYQRCDFVMFVSLYEGFGLPIIEAQACGRPVITSNAHSMPEVAGAGACIVDPASASEIRAAVVRMIEDRSFREDIVRAGLENVARFRADRIAARYAELYRQVLREAQSG